MGETCRTRSRAAVGGGATALALAAATLVGFPAVASSAAGPSEYVSTSGTDSGNCPKSAPCKTINYAISKAASGETIRVEKGTYHQTVDVNKPVNILGASASSTTINGAGLDPSNDGYFGVVYVGNSGGSVTVSGFKITNPYPYTYTGGEPMAVVLEDQNPADT